MSHLFGTDGVRGRVNEGAITVESFLALGKAIGYYFSSRRPSRKIRHNILIGKDTRVSNYMLEQSLSAGICSMGADSTLLGPMPTPGISFITESMRADAGCVISASHNSYQFNGLKLFNEIGEKITREQEDEIANLYQKFLVGNAGIRSAKIGKCERLRDVLGRYIVHLKHHFPAELNVGDYCVLLDCAHGATYKVAPITFYELGCDVKTIGNNPDGYNINHKIGSTYLNTLTKVMQRSDCDVGFAFDGDGDRCLAVSKFGHIFDGDRIIAMMAHYNIEVLKREMPPIVLTNMSNTGLIIYLQGLGCEVKVVSVGDRNVQQEMKRQNSILGGEPSGHIIFGDQFRTGDGMLTAINMLRVMAHTEKGCDVFYHLYDQFPSILKNVTVKTKEAFSKKTELTILKIEKEVGKEGKVFVRYSGTEPCVRIMIEGKNKDKIRSYAEDIAATF
jgi:phosphoglucosamine mutase